MMNLLGNVINGHDVGALTRQTDHHRANVRLCLAAAGRLRKALTFLPGGEDVEALPWYMLNPVFEGNRLRIRRLFKRIVLSQGNAVSDGLPEMQVHITRDENAGGG